MAQPISGKEAAKNPQPVVENNNIINQDDFQKNLQDDLVPKKVNIINEETADQEELKTLFWGEVWDEYLRRQNIISYVKMFYKIKNTKR